MTTRDSQLPLKSPAGGVPVVSPLVHVLAMPLLVIFRRGFGYLFLSPKSIFLSLCFANGLMAFAVAEDPALQGLRPLALFGSVTSVLYVIHLLIAVVEQQRETAEHDQGLGSSWLLLPFHGRVKPAGEFFCRCLIEPGIAAIFGLFFLRSWLGPFLIVSAISLSLKELIRAWLSLRMRKRLADNLEDVEETMLPVRPSQAPVIAPSGRTASEKFARRFDDSEAKPAEEAHARELRLLPPYTIAQAKANFDKLAGDLDPENPADGAYLARLTAALAYFQNR